MTGFILTMLLGTCIVRLVSLRRDTLEERTDIRYQVTVFLITLLAYTIVSLIIDLIIKCI